MKSSLLANNIGILRTTFGETQLDLALVLGLNSPNTISNYESGNRKPNDETIRKMAKHYNITEYELCNIDLSFYLKAKNMLHRDLAYFGKNSKKKILTIFPVFYTKEDKANEAFVAAYKRHCEIISKLSEDFNDVYMDELYFEIDEIYCNLYLENDDYISLANSIGIQCLYESNEIFDERFLLKKDFETLPSNPKYKDIYLTNCLDDGNEETKKMKLDENIELDIELLMECPEFKDLSYYYIALRYIYGAVADNLTLEMSDLIGRTMMAAFAKAGNKYALRYFRLLNKIITEA